VHRCKPDGAAAKKRLNKKKKEQVAREKSLHDAEAAESKRLIDTLVANGMASQREHEAKHQAYYDTEATITKLRRYGYCVLWSQGRQCAYHSGGFLVPPGRYRIYSDGLIANLWMRQLTGSVVIDCDISLKILTIPLPQTTPSEEGKTAYQTGFHFPSLSRDVRIIVPGVHSPVFLMGRPASWSRILGVIPPPPRSLVPLTYVEWSGQLDNLVPIHDNHDDNE
jgi:hypothetical protein